ncbi:hypothetical protein ARMSODRAFT_964343, partial [Armillaria solidipes]
MGTSPSKPSKRSSFNGSSNTSTGGTLCTNAQYEILLGTAFFVLVILILHRWIRKRWSSQALKVADDLGGQGIPTEMS